MSRRFTLVTVTLAAVVAFLVGAIVAGGFVRSAVSAGTSPKPAAAGRVARTSTSTAPPMASLVNFADVVERLNPAVVNIDTTTRGNGKRSRSRGARPTDPSDDGPLDFGPPRDRESTPRRGAGSGF